MKNRSAESFPITEFKKIKILKGDSGYMDFQVLIIFRLMHTPKYLCDVTWHQKRKEKLDDLKYSSGSDIESQNIFNNV